MDEHFVFVYGTLKAGKSNHGLLENATLLGVAFTNPNTWNMVNLGAYPALVEAAGPSPRIKGEVYVVDDETLKNLDILEGYPEFYTRKRIRTYRADGRFAYVAFVYYMSEAPEGYTQIVESGEW